MQTEDEMELVELVQSDRRGGRGKSGTNPDDEDDSAQAVVMNDKDHSVEEYLGKQIIVILAIVIVAGGVLLGYAFGKESCKDRWQERPMITKNNNKNLTYTRHDNPPKYLFLLGERNSGTNYIEKTLKNAFFPRYSITGNSSEKVAHYPFAGCSPEAHPLQQQSCSPVFKFKHMFRHSLLSDREVQLLRERADAILWILAVRSPCDWADGMFRKPWQMCNPSDPPSRCKNGYIGVNKNALNGVSRASFFGDMPWWENTEARFNDQDFVYPGGIFELRAHKLRLMLQLMDAVGPYRVKLAHLKYVELSAETFVRNTAKEFGLDLNMAREKLLPSNQLHETTCLTEQEWRVAEAKINWDLEGKFGFSSLDCHLCL